MGADAEYYQRKLAEKTLRKIVRYWGLRGVKLAIGKSPGNGDIWLERSRADLDEGGHSSALFLIRSNMLNGLPPKYHTAVADKPWIDARFRFIDLRVSLLPQ